MGRLSRRQARRLLIALGCGAGGYALYRWYWYSTSKCDRSPSTWARLQRAWRQYSDSFVAAAEVSSDLMADVQRFLQSDQNEVPPSLVQLMKLASSPEACTTLTRLSAAARTGLLPMGSWDTVGQGADAGTAPARPWTEQLMDALVSERGQTLVSLVIGVGARNMVKTLCEHYTPTAAGGAQGSIDGARALAIGRPATGEQRQPTAAGPSWSRDRAGLEQQSWLQRFFDVLATPNGKDVMVVALDVFVHRAVSTWVDAIPDVDAWQQIFAAASDPRHRPMVERATHIFTRTAVRSAFACAREPASSTSYRPLQLEAAARVRPPRTPPLGAADEDDTRGAAAPSGTQGLQPGAADGRQAGGPLEQAAECVAAGYGAGVDYLQLGASSDSESLDSGPATSWDHLQRQQQQQAAAAGKGAGQGAGATLRSAVEGGVLVGATLTEVLRKVATAEPETRSLVLDLTSTAVGEAVRATLHSVLPSWVTSPSSAAAGADAPGGRLAQGQSHLQSRWLAASVAYFFTCALLLALLYNAGRWVPGSSMQTLGV